MTRERWTCWLALLGSSVCGLMFDFVFLKRALLHRPPLHENPGDVSAVGELLGNVVLPVTVTALAPRKSFLWAAAALGIYLVWCIADQVVSLNGPGLLSDLKANGLYAALTLFLLCGPISLIRFYIRQKREERAQRIDGQQSLMNQVDTQGGVWPPPIRTDGYFGSHDDKRL